MLPLIFSVVEIAFADSYAIVRLQLSSPDSNFYTGDIVSITSTIAFAESLSPGAKFNANLELIIEE